MLSLSKHEAEPTALAASPFDKLRVRQESAEFFLANSPVFDAPQAVELKRWDALRPDAIRRPSRAVRVKGEERSVP